MKTCSVKKSERAIDRREEGQKQCTDGTDFGIGISGFRRQQVRRQAHQAKKERR